MHTHPLILANRGDVLLASQMHSRKTEAEITRDVALNERIESLEEKIQSILQENLQLKAEINQAHDLYQQRKEKTELEKKEILYEIAPLEKQVNQLNTAIETKSKENLELSQKIITQRSLRDLIHRSLFYITPLFIFSKELLN